MKNIFCNGMDIDWYMRLYNTMLGKDTALFIEYKTDYNTFEEFKTGKEAKLLERLVNYNRVERDIAIFATHKVSCENAVKLSDLTIKKIDSLTGINLPQGDASLENCVFQ